MKKSGLISLICSMLLVIVLALAAVFTMIFTGVFSAEREKLVISSSSAMAVYNGEALTDRGWHLVEGNLKSGHSLSVNVSGSQTGVGISENYISAKVLDKKGADVSGDYSIEYRPGALNVKPRSMTVVAGSEMKAFDGTPLTCDEYELESGISLVDGETLFVDIEGEITEPGEAANVIKSVKITNKKGSDVTRNYDIDTVNGKLIVYTEQTIVVSSDDDSKYYDGEALTNANWYLDSGILNDGDKLSVEVTGTRTNVGTSENSLSVRILNADGKDVTKNYKIITNPGNLTVIKRDVTIVSGSDTKLYDGLPLRCDEYTCEPAFLKENGFILDVSIIGTQTLVGKSDNTIASCSIYNSDEEDVTKNFNITLKTGVLEVTETPKTKVPLSITTLSDTKTYDGKPLTNANWEFFGDINPDHHLDVKVTGEITNAGKADNTVEVKVLDAGGKDVSEFYEIKKSLGTLTVNPAEITVKAGTAEKKFDGKPLTSNEFDVIAAFYRDDFEFEVVTSGQQIEVGSSINEISSVNVYMKDSNGEVERDEEGNILSEKVTQNFKITRESGTLKVVEADAELAVLLIYKSGSATKVYDGTVLECKEYELVEGALMEGHRVVVDISRSIVDAGKTENTISVTIYDGETGVNVNSLYNIKYDPGTLTVTKRQITVKSDSAEKRYDGEPLTAPGYTYEPEDALVYGHTLTVTVSGSAVNVTGPEGIPNTISGCKITADAERDVTSNYEIIKEEGTLRIEAKPEITIKTDNAEKVYDGEPLFASSWTHTGDLMPGHILTVVVTGDRTDAGTSENTATVEISDADGTSVIDYYDVKYELGELLVKKRPVTITAGSAQKLYDGESLTCEEFSITPAYLTSTFDFYVSCDGEQRFIGESPNGIGDYLIELQGVDVTDNFEVTEKEGTLRVAASPDDLLIEVVFSSGSDEKVYDGTPLRCEEYTLVGGALNPAHEVQRVDYLSSITDVGTEENTIAVTIVDSITGEDVTALYDIRYEPGTLKVTKRDITVTSNSDSKMYDGTPLTNSGFSYEKSKLVKGHKIVAEITGVAQEVTEGVPNTISSVKIMATVDGEEIDVSDNYEIKKEEGTLVITPNNRSKIIVYTEDAESTYNGEPFTNHNFFYEGNLDPNHKILITVTGEGTIPGLYENTAYVTITDEYGNYVTDEYDIEYHFGSLTIKKCPVTITSDSKQQVYNGTPLTSNDFTLSPTHLSDSFVFTVYCGGSQTEVGISDNPISEYYVEKDGEDVTDYFEVTCVAGTLKVVATEEELYPTITVSSGSETREYDGCALVLYQYEIISGELLPGHVIENVEFYGYIGNDEIGKADNTFKIHIYDEATGEEVTSEYIIKYEPGTLEVTEREITIRSNSDSKTYDGTELKNPGFTYDEDKLLPGHVIDAFVIGSVTDVTEAGGVPNTISGYVITDEQGNSVSGFYKVTVEEGTLTVNPAEPEDSDEPRLDLSGSLLGTGANSQDSVYFIIQSSVDKTVYLKLQSYGDYTGSGWAEALDYSKLLHTGSAYYITPEALEYSYYSKATLKIDPVAGYYALPYYTALQSASKQTSDVLISGKADKAYSVSFYYEANGFVSGMMLPSEYRSFEEAYYTYVYNNYRYVDPDTKAYILEYVVPNLGLSENASVATKINKVIAYLNTFEYNLEYDAELDSEDNIVVAFLSRYREGVCRHFASAATLILRTLDVPTRYTVGFAAPVDKNVSTEITGENAHAWIEVYSEGGGWYNVETTPSRSNPATGSKEPVKFEIKPTALSAQYPKTTVLKHSGAVMGFPALLSELGYTYEAEVSGEISGLGYGSASVTGFIIKDSAGNVVYDKRTGLGSDIFIVKYTDVSDALHLYLDKLTFKSTSKSQEYDGTALTTLLSDIKKTNSVELADGYELIIIPTGTITDVGSAKASFDIKILKDGREYDENNKSYTSHYSITKSVGNLTVSARNITIQAGSASMPYDNGRPLTCDEYEIIEGELALGDVETVVITGEVSSPKEKASNVIESVTIMRGGKDVTKNYNIKTIEGHLEITS